jgi:hypothetical protein
MRTLIIIGVLVALAAAACATDDSGDPPPAEDVEADLEDTFVGLAKAEAIARAEDEDRPWRIGREDEEVFAFDAELLVGRVTFEVDEGVVTNFSIEVDTPPSVGDVPIEDPDRAAVIVAAISRLLTVDNTFGGGDVFDDVRVADTIGGDDDDPLQPIELELIAAAVQHSATVTFIGDADALAEELFEASPQGVAIVSVDGLRMESDRAEIDLGMWCGSLCGTWLTYEAVAGLDGWEITGPIGPIAVS